MTLFDQILLKIFSIIAFLFSLFLLVIGFGWFETNAHLIIDYLYDYPEARITLLIVTLITAAISLRFILFGMRRKSEPPAVSKRSEYGETRISVTTLENIANKAVQKISGVRDWKVKVRVSEIEGNHYFIKVISDGETPIPQMTEQIQQEVKHTVEALTGIEIHQVSVMISDIVNPESARPRRVE